MKQREKCSGRKDRTPFIWLHFIPVILVHDYQELDFVKVEVAPETVAIDSDFTFEDLEVENTKQAMESEAAPVLIIVTGKQAKCMSGMQQTEI